MLPRMIGQPFTENYDLVEEEMQFCTSHTNNVFKSDNNVLFQIDRNCDVLPIVKYNLL